MKRKTMIAAGLTAALCLCLCACGADSTSASQSASSAPASSAASAPASSAAASTPDSAADSAVSAAAGTVSVNSVSEAILAANPIDNPFTLSDVNMSLDLGLEESSYVSYACTKSNDNGDAGTVFVIEAADGQADNVKTELESYRDAQAAQLSNYAEFADAQANMENAIIQANGNIVVMAVASNACTDTAALQSAVDAALN